MFVLLMAFPAVSSAAMLKLNDLSDQNQFLATTSDTTSMHLKIEPSGGNTHTFKWNGIPWSINQGGTGTTTFSNGSILFFSSIFSEDNANFFWSSTTKSLGIRNSSPMHALDVSGSIYSRLVTLSPSSSVTVDWNSGNVNSLTLSSSQTTLTFSNPQAGGEYKLILNQDGTGGRTVVWPASVKWPSGVPPILSSAPNSIDLISFVYTGSAFLGTYNLDYQTPGTLSNSLISYWNFQSNSDDSVGSNDGTDTDISYSSGAVFNGSTSKISHSATSFPTGNSDRTINVWYKPSAQTSQSIFFYGAESSNAMQQIYYDGSNLSYSGYANDYSVSQILNNNTWYMITAKLVSGVAHIYVNGSEVGSGFTASAWNTSSGGGCFGRQNCSTSSYPLNGTVKYTGVWNRALNNTEINQLYNSGSGLPYPF